MFQTGFDVNEYMDMYPSLDTYLQNDEIINFHTSSIHENIWRPQTYKVITEDIKMKEVRRILKTGVLIRIKDDIVWIPPNYYFFLNYFNVNGMFGEFRLNRLKSILDEIRLLANPRALGTLTAKSRGIGETSFRMSELLLESALMDHGVLGIQSKTLKTVKESCWRVLLMGWDGIEQWLKELIFPDFTSKDKTATAMKFWRQADPSLDLEGIKDKGKNVVITYAAGAHNAFDSVHDMRRFDMDEWFKWVEASPYATFLNSKKFMAVGNMRKGWYSIFSSPADVETKYVKETYDFWQGSDPAKLTKYGTTETGIFRVHISPLTGIPTFYDKWGDADANEIYDHIMHQRKVVPKEYRMAEVRGFPLNDEEIFGSFDSGHAWSNQKGVSERKVYIMGHKFKDEKTKEPTVLYGNIEWQGGEIDTETQFRISDRDSFDLETARWAITDIPSFRNPLEKTSEGALAPPRISCSCLGIDPIDKRYVTQSGKGFSNGAMVNWVFSDLLMENRKKYPNLIYSCRPTHADIFFEDAIKTAVFTRSLVQPENVNSKIIDYFEDRGYSQWMLPKRGEAKNSVRKGDSPTGTFLSEMILLLDSITNTPLKIGDPYLLESVWFWELLDDFLKFNVKDRHKNDLTIAWGMSLMGAIKMMGAKVRKPSEINNAMLSYLLD